MSGCDHRTDEQTPVGSSPFVSSCLCGAQWNHKDTKLTHNVPQNVLRIMYRKMYHPPRRRKCKRQLDFCTGGRWWINRKRATFRGKGRAMPRVNRTEMCASEEVQAFHLINRCVRLGGTVDVRRFRVSKASSSLRLILQPSIYAMLPAD